MYAKHTHVESYVKYSTLLNCTELLCTVSTLTEIVIYRSVPLGKGVKGMDGRDVARGAWPIGAFIPFGSVVHDLELGLTHELPFQFSVYLLLLH